MVALSASLAAARAFDVPRWQPRDFSFSAKTDTANPFMVPFSATVTAPDGKTFALPGFFDGDGTWKVRVSPNAEGKWSLVTKSEVKELDGQKAEFTCVKSTYPNAHGVLRVDKEHPHHFIFEDGSRFFMQGYEYDWLWALDMDKPGVPTVDATLDLIAKYGFNYVILNSYAHDTKWREGKTGDDDFGPPSLYAWEGSNESPDHGRMNLAYWKHYDLVMEALARRGMQAHMLIKVYNKDVKWPAHGSDEEKLFFRWLVARYAAYPNLIWDFSKEAHNEKGLAYKQDWLKWLRENDPYHHLTTVHDDDKANESGAYDDLTDFRADQHHGNLWDGKNGKNGNRIGNNHRKILDQRARRAWPVANVESDYECGPGGADDKTYREAQTPEDMMDTLWEIAMAGGYVAYYYTYTAWDVVRPLDLPPGYALMKHFGDFWRATEYWTLEPSSNLVSVGYCLAKPGSEYVVFQKRPVPFTLEIAGAKAAWKADWIDTRTGKRVAADPIENGTARLAPPADWGDSPLVLHVKAR
ncbi:MAG: DUF5060 domain-containing protein [Opitutales bacterium]